MLVRSIECQRFEPNKNFFIQKHTFSLVFTTFICFFSHVREQDFIKTDTGIKNEWIKNE